MTEPYQLGKLPARGAVKLRYNDYITRPPADLFDWLRAVFAWMRHRRPTPKPTPKPTGLPTPPQAFGTDTLPTFAMQGNSQAGCCVEAGAIHEIRRWTKLGYGTPAPFKPNAGLALYADWTGYVIGDKSTDHGTDMALAASLRRNEGITDADGTTHRVGAYLALDAGDTDQLTEAAYLFGAVGVGVRFPVQWMEDFKRGKPWGRLWRPRYAGGHYVPVVGRAANGNYVVVTWGRLHELTAAGYRQFNDESLAYINSDWLGPDTESPQGFNLDRLKHDLAVVTDAL